MLRVVGSTLGLLSGFTHIRLYIRESFEFSPVELNKKVPKCSTLANW